MTMLSKGGYIGSETRSKIDEEVGGGKTVCIKDKISVFLQTTTGAGQELLTMKSDNCQKV